MMVLGCSRLHASVELPAVGPEGEATRSDHVAKTPREANALRRG